MPGASSMRRRPKVGLASSAVVAKDMEASPGNARQRADHDGENRGAGGDDRPGSERESGPPDGPVGGGSGHGRAFRSQGNTLNRMFILSPSNSHRKKRKIFYIFVFVYLKYSKKSPAR